MTKPVAIFCVPLPVSAITLGSPGERRTEPDEEDALQH